MHLPGEKWVWNPCQGLLWCWKPANNNNNNHIILRCTSTKVKVAWVTSNMFACVAGVKRGRGRENLGTREQATNMIIQSGLSKVAGCQRKSPPTRGRWAVSQKPKLIWMVLVPGTSINHWHSHINKMLGIRDRWASPQTCCFEWNNTFKMDDK